MRKSIAIFIWVIISIQICDAQSGEPRSILKNQKFDRTIELRKMKIVVAEKSAKTETQEVPNYRNSIAFDLKLGNEQGPEPFVQKSHGSFATGNPISSIEGISDHGHAPSDANGDVGLNHYVQSVNTAVSIYDKSCNLLYGPVSLSTLWDGFDGEWEGSNSGDPIVVYDELADRWLISQFYIPEDIDNGTYYQLIAISTSEDPLGSWYRYAFPFDEFNDYPKFGVWPDGYYSTYNMFDKATQDNVHKGSSFVVFQRDSMLQGMEEVTGVSFDSESLSSQLPEGFGYFSVSLPADFDGLPPDSQTPFPIIGITSNAIPVLFEINMNWNNVFNSRATFKQVINAGSFNQRMSEDGIPQPGHGFLLDPQGDRFMHRLQYRNFESYEVLMLNISEDVDETVGIRWVELRRQTEDWEIFQQGTYSPDSLHRWMGSIAMNGLGEIALGYSVGGKQKWASVRYTGRQANDELGSMSFREIESMTGRSNEPFHNRWGDYSSMSVDPSDDVTFWYTSQCSGGDLWKTNIVKFKLGESFPPIVDAGSDATICSSDRYNASPAVSNHKYVHWTTEGDGNLLWADELDAQYKPGIQDIEKGHVYLVLNAYGWEVGSVSQDSLLLTIENCTGIEQNDLNRKISVTPNPSSGLFSIMMDDFAGQNMKIQILNAQGRIIFTQRLDHLDGSYSSQIDMGSYPKGTYYMKFITHTAIVTRKLIKL